MALVDADEEEDEGEGEGLDTRGTMAADVVPGFAFALFRRGEDLTEDFEVLVSLSMLMLSGLDEPSALDGPACVSGSGT